MGSRRSALPRPCAMIHPDIPRGSRHSSALTGGARLPRPLGLRNTLRNSFLGTCRAINIKASAVALWAVSSSNRKRRWWNDFCFNAVWVFVTNRCWNLQFPAECKTCSCRLWNDWPAKVDAHVHVCVYDGDGSLPPSSLNAPFMIHQG